MSNQAKPQTESDIDIEILVNAVMAAKNSANAAEAALRSFLRKRAGVSSGGASGRQVPPTFMARATRMVHTNQPDTPEGESNAGQSEGSSGDGGGHGYGREPGDGGEDPSRGDGAQRQDTERSHIQQG